MRLICLAACALAAAACDRSDTPQISVDPSGVNQAEVDAALGPDIQALPEAELNAADNIADNSGDNAADDASDEAADDASDEVADEASDEVADDSATEDTGAPAGE